MNITRIAGVALAGTMVFGVAACGNTTQGEGSDELTSVGISMPTRELERWINDGAQLQELLEDEGFETDLQYAQNDTGTQISQIQNQIASGVDVLVIAAIDGEVLAPVLEQAAEEDITVIAYDRLINGTPNVDYYATFDNYEVGQLQGNFIVEQLDLENTDETFNLEPFAGSPDDNNARFFFSGAWDVLLPYIEDGTLEVPSGNSPASNDQWASIGIQGWESAGAQSEMENRLSSFYTGGEQVDVVLSPNDSLALGIAEALSTSGYTPGEDWPILTGQDADRANVINILDDRQSMTVWKDTRLLGQAVFEMIVALRDGGEPEINDTETYDNGEKVVPTYLIEPEVVTKDTVEEKLVDSEFLSAEDIGL
ncbi:substrate-binding domain-containing protein [Nesterenkonia flava]|uniref:Sugar ABC transporter substrate-binding protein n=1 Tax=Nesterenkonia flava TaxID=469799 RepID=A0ABU1FSD8_9MICC|nr:substrate-binding domain-containing protein [Nesterenkonia flava]MDR5711533.1 sugar ABC transporter substrate-binding protein [Nesterenkonia flava]